MARPRTAEATQVAATRLAAAILDFAAGLTGANRVDCHIEDDCVRLAGRCFTLAELAAAAAARGQELATAARNGGHTAAIEVSVQYTYPGLQTEENTPIARLVRQAGGGTAPALKLNFGTEGGLFNDMLGVPTVVCGPGSIDRAHKPDEFITRDELAAGDAFLDRIVHTLG